MSPAAAVATAPSGQHAAPAAGDLRPESSAPSSARVAVTTQNAGSSASPSSASSSLWPPLVVAADLPSGAHPERCHSVCCSDSHVFVGGGSISGTICVWKIPPHALKAFAERMQDFEKALVAQKENGGPKPAFPTSLLPPTRGDESAWEFVGVFAQMALPVVQVKLNCTKDRLAAVTQAGICYIWDVSPAALASLSQRLPPQMSLAPFASLSSSSSLPSWLANVFATPAVSPTSGLAASPSSASPSLPASVSSLLRVTPKPLAVLGGADTPANVSCVEFLPDGVMVAAGSGLPLSVDVLGREKASAPRAPLGLYHCESGQRLAEFPSLLFSPSRSAHPSHASRAPLLLSSISTVAMDPHRFPQPLPSSQAASQPQGTPPSSARWIAAGDGACGCIALILIPDELMIHLRRQHEAHLHAWDQKETLRLSLKALRRRRDEAAAAAETACQEPQGDAGGGAQRPDGDVVAAEKDREKQRLKAAAEEAERAYQEARAKAAAGGESLKDKEGDEDGDDGKRPAPHVHPAFLQNLATVVVQLSEAAPVEMTSLAWRPRRQGHRGPLHLCVGCVDGFVRLVQLNPVLLPSSSAPAPLPTLQMRSIVLCKVASGTGVADVRSLLCLRPFSRRGHLTVAACNTFGFPSSFASAFCSSRADLSASLAAPLGGSAEKETEAGANSPADLYQVKCVTGLGEAGDEIASCVHAHSDFVCGVAASACGVFVVSLAADKSLCLYVRTEAAAEQLRREEARRILDEENKLKRAREEEEARKNGEEERRRAEAAEAERRRLEEEELAGAAGDQAMPYAERTEELAKSEEVAEKGAEATSAKKIKGSDCFSENEAQEPEAGDDDDLFGDE
ncbi:hypothetical protein BESB_073450 [Besnoitia besnoiti]|uniref:WD domain, G-beta repeat-containing protein n=1 Tax=Besnoitia besnoiti TaxID=94643 RepID=A0A2A9MET8_BESBE|nr:uncharacterized protein BESB_073450 [Besnoitia besnoiti]PFH34193.1 hypothetical protein BESB_073450 [Besnoitia besnoiti]